MIKKYVEVKNAARMLFEAKRNELKESNNAISAGLVALIGVAFVIIAGFLFKNFLFTDSMTLTFGDSTGTGNGLFGALIALVTQFFQDMGKSS